MLQAIAMMFFSVTALGAAGVLSGTLIENWIDVKRALRLDARNAALPGRVSVRIRLVRTTPTAARRSALRAAA